MPRYGGRVLFLRVVVTSSTTAAGSRVVIDGDPLHSGLWIDGVQGETRSCGLDGSSVKRIGVTSVWIKGVQ